MSQDAQGAPVPGVATGYEVSEDGLTYTFALRPEARWSNGDPVVAGDFVYAWRRAVDPATASPYAWFIELMQVEGATAIIAGEATPDTLGVSAPDDRTLVVTLTTPVPYLPGMVTNPITFPVHQATVEEHGDQWTQPGNLVSNGAYTLSERVPQERIVLTRNPLYWDDANTTIETVTTLVITDEQQALTRWQDGEVDKTAVVPVGQFPRLQEEFPGEAIAVPNMCTYYYQVNLRPDAPEFLQDPRVREALNLAIDRDVIVENILAGGQEPAYTLTHWATNGFEVPQVPAAAMTQEERVARAQELMAEAGYGEGGEPLSVEIIFNTSESHQQIAVAVGQMWKQSLGIETTLANQEWQTFLDTRKEAHFELARAAWCADYNEPSSFLDILTVNSEANDSRYANPEFDAPAWTRP
jgi:oligopeptide transport system substrate-binding protein